MADLYLALTHFRRKWPVFKYGSMDRLVHGPFGLCIKRFMDPHSSGNRTIFDRSGSEPNINRFFF